MAKYGVFIGRFQPFHLGHETVVHEIIADGLTPYLIVGSSNKKDKRNPLSLIDRISLIKKVFPDIEIGCSPDYEKWGEWYDVLLQLNKSIQKDKVVIYSHRKPKDYTSFEFKGSKYLNAHYHQIFEDEGFKVKLVTYPQLNIDGTTIRENLTSNRHLLDGRVYRSLKDLGFNGKISYNGKEEEKSRATR